MTNKILIGNCFSLTLMRGGEVTVSPQPLDVLRKLLASGVEVVSYWGHENTRAVAERILGVSLKTKSPRPALCLVGDKKKPMLDGEVFDTCWVLSPDYVPGYRPSIGEEADESKITGWQVLKLSWKGND